MAWIRVACIAVLAATVPGCEQQGAGTVRSGLRDSASVRADPGDVTPMQLRTWVQVGGGAVPDSNCAWHLRVYTPENDERPVWNSARLGSRGCPPPPVAPGSFGRTDDAGDILGDSLPPGPYRFAVLLRANGDTTEIDAGRVFVTADPRSPLRAPDGLTYRVRTTVARTDPARVRVAVRAINASDRRVLLEYGACSLNLLVHRSAERRMRPVWNSAKQVDETGQMPVCLLYLKQVEIGPGEGHEPGEFRIAYTVDEILGDSLPVGPYHFTARLVLGGDTIALPAGSAVLR